MASSAWQADEQQAEWYTRQIATFAQQKQLQKAIDTYQQLVDAGLRPTSYTFSALINAYVLAGDVSGGERVMSEMRAAGCLPNVVTYTTLLKGHCAVGDLEAAKALLLEMTTSTPPVKADLRACNTFLRGARRHTCMRMAPRHAPHPVTAAAGCIRVGDLRAARWMWGMLPSWGVVPDHVARINAARLRSQGLFLGELRKMLRDLPQARRAQHHPTTPSPHGATCTP